MEYNPQKSYTWKPEDKFEISGSQFGMILNTFRTILSSPLAAMFRNIEQANVTVEEIMATGVQSGIIKEIELRKEETNDEKV
jgi:hypothetical protein